MNVNVVSVMYVSYPMCCVCCVCCVVLALRALRVLRVCDCTYTWFHLLHAVHVHAHPVVLVLYGHAFEVLGPRHWLSHHLDTRPVVVEIARASSRPFGLFLILNFTSIACAQALPLPFAKFYITGISLILQ